MDNDPGISPYLDPAVRTYIGDIRCRIRGLRPTPAKGTPCFCGPALRGDSIKTLKMISRTSKKYS